ncbi:RNA polymerase sigma factor [Streptomyces phage phiBT1]|uniref:Gp12 n=1 Tax=Lomovskayavirus BT1 TaxID=225588 RepID=Q858Z0_9CAUD|nr:RNA polymerase sigma factor [Streptomyces phage phiBT1]CAD80135.1 gp12 [Lomovskayavirus BT1]
MLTFDVIRAAQNNDLDAVTTVIKATESRIDVLARKAANRMAPHGGARFADYADEFAQVGRVAVWDCLKRFTDTTVESFERYVYTTVETTLKDAVRSERNGNAGADPDAVKVFAAMLEAADGDVYEAARLAQIIPPKGKRLSPDRAEAARMAWQGAVSLDKQHGTAQGHDNTGAAGTTLADTLQHHDEELDGEIRPKVGHGAALEALSVLGRYAGVRITPGTPGEFAANLPTLVDLLEDAVTLPRDAEERRYVLDAMAVLRAAVSTATEGALDDDLRDARDDRMADSAEKHARVNDCLDSMGAAQRDVLRHSFGIKGVTDFGWGDGCDLDGLCAFLGMTSQNARAHRAKGRKAFAKRYVAAVKLDRPNYAAALEAAAAANCTYGGRK